MFCHCQHTEVFIEVQWLFVGCYSASFVMPAIVYHSGMMLKLNIWAAKLKSDRPTLYVVMMVFLSILRVVPASAFRNLFLFLTFALMLVACAAKWSRLSKGTLRILGYWNVGVMLSSTLTFSFLLTSFVHNVKRETNDLGTDRRRFLFRKKFTVDVS